MSHLKVAERDYFGIYYAVGDQRVGVLYVRACVLTHLHLPIVTAGHESLPLINLTIVTMLACCCFLTIHIN